MVGSVGGFGRYSHGASVTASQPKKMLKPIDLRAVKLLTGCPEPSDFAFEPEEMLGVLPVSGFCPEPFDCSPRTVHLLSFNAACIAVVEGFRPLPSEVEGSGCR